MHKRTDFVKAIIMVILSLVGSVLACIDQFHKAGFSLCLIGIAIAILSIVIMTRDNLRERAEE